MAGIGASLQAPTLGTKKAATSIFQSVNRSAGLGDLHSL
jgi:hypothetical protein